jgi:hypothetical protein
MLVNDARGNPVTASGPLLSCARSIWPHDFSDKEKVLTHGGPILSLAVLADGRLASGGEDGNIKIWP